MEKVPVRDQNGKIKSHKHEYNPYLPSELKHRFKLVAKHTPHGEEYEIVPKDPQETLNRKKGAVNPQDKDYIKKFVKNNGRGPLGSKTTQKGVALPARDIMSMEIGSKAALNGKNINNDEPKPETKFKTETNVRKIDGK